MSPLRQSQRTILVTGGSSGIGAAFCRAAAKYGWRVLVGFGTGADRARALAAEIAAGGGYADCIAIPLHEPERIGEAVAALRGEAAPEALALCAGAAPDVSAFTKLTPQQLRKQFEIAVVGNHTLIAETWKQCMRPQGGGHVLAVLTAALGPPASPHMAGYIAAKGGLYALLEAAAAELGTAGLRVSTVRPGYVETPMLAAFEPRLLERARERAAGGRFLLPEDVASALLAALRAPPEAGTVSEVPVRMHMTEKEQHDVLRARA